MKKILFVVVGCFFPYFYLLSQNIIEINKLYNNACNIWESSSKQALPFFEKLYYQIEPLYNRYYTNNYIISDGIHKVSRNYIRFMNEYYIKGFGGKQYIEYAWKMSQAIKGYESLKEYNALMLLNFKNNELIDIINNTDIYDYSELRKLNEFVGQHTNNILFLETPTIQEVQNKLHNDDLYISFNFSLNDRSFYIISISQTDVDVYKSKITTYELFNRIAVLKGIINEDDNLINIGNLNLSAKGLYSTDKFDENLRPIEKEINQAIKKYSKKNLIIENDIIISQIPFDLLQKDSLPFYHKYNITYVPNASYYVKLHNTMNYSKTIVGISPELNKEDIIMEQEIKILKDVYNANILTKCSRDIFLSFLKENHCLDILHLSSHFNREFLTRELEKIEINGKKYYLDKLSSKEGGYFSFGDSNVSIQDIFSQNQSKAKTLILSGCETATSDDVLSIINPLFDYEIENGKELSIDESDNDGKRNINLQIYSIINQGCYCNNTKSFDNLFLLAISFSPQYIIAFQNNVHQASSWKFFNEFYLNYQKFQDTKQAFFNTKCSLMDLNDANYLDYASIILVCK